MKHHFAWNFTGFRLPAYFFFITEGSMIFHNIHFCIYFLLPKKVFKLAVRNRFPTDVQTFAISSRKDYGISLLLQ